MLRAAALDDFIGKNQLPDKFRSLISEYYDPLATWIANKTVDGRPILLGINGAQGSGKSTLAEYLKFSLEANSNWRVAVLSIDDFYLTKKERLSLCDDLHPLLITRGVPGTHDVAMLLQCLQRLRKLNSTQELELPRFDKSRDDRAPVSLWPVISGPINLIILEGWCVGALPQSAEKLRSPINRLEREQDADGIWRSYVNRQLEQQYTSLFATLDGLVFLKIPDFDAVFRWRLEQEKKLAERVTDGDSTIMDNAELALFIQHYERITKECLATMSARADVTLELNANHDCVGAYYATDN